MKLHASILLLGFISMQVTYSLIMWPIFQWRNPKANSMTYYSEFKSVLSFQKMEKYQ